MDLADNAPPALYTTRAYTGGCVFSPEQESQALLPGVIAAVLPSLIRTSLGALQAALFEASDRDELTITSTVNTEFGGDQNLQPCIQFVRGWIFTRATDGYGPTNEDIFGLGDASFVDVTNRRIREEGIYLATQPDFFVEARLEVSEDTSAMALTPYVLFYRRNFGTQSLRGSREARDLAITFAVGEPASAGDNGRGPVATLQFDKVPPGDRAYRFVDDDGVASGPRTPWISFRSPDANSPRYFALSVTETTNANAFFKFLHDVLAGANESLASALESNLVPAKVAEAKQAAEDIALAAVTDAINKQQEALVSYEAFADKRDGGAGAGELIAEAATALADIYAANLAARRADRTKPFSDTSIEELEQVLREAGR